MRGVGANAGRTAEVTLDLNHWAAVSADPNDGYVYDDPAGSRGGITHILFRRGLLTIQAGAGFQWSPAGAQDEVWVHMRIADTGLCSRFLAANATTNASGDFEASGATAPASRSRPSSAMTATSRPATAARPRARPARATRRASRRPSMRSSR